MLMQVIDSIDCPTVVVDLQAVLELARPLLESPHFRLDLQKTAERINDDAADELDRLLDMAARANSDFARVKKEIQKIDSSGFARVRF